MPALQAEAQLARGATVTSDGHPEPGGKSQVANYSPVVSSQQVLTLQVKGEETRLASTVAATFALFNLSAD